MEHHIKQVYEVSQAHEISMGCFLIIYGKHINGWFIAIPNWGIFTEAVNPQDVFGNMEKLSRNIKIRNIKGASELIAKAVKEHWESINA